VKFEFIKNPDGTILVQQDHNNRAPGLLRVFVNDNRAVPTKKMADIKKNPEFQKMVLEYMNREASTVLFRFNGNLIAGGGKGILIQDATQKFQNAQADAIGVIVSDDVVVVPVDMAAVEAAIIDAAKVEDVPVKIVDLNAPAAPAVDVPVAEAPVVE
jgi:hypothetical protein